MQGAEAVYFRDQLIAASLKLAVPVDHAEVTHQNFRDQLIAASLKRSYRCLQLVFDLSFPRSADRGLIEAVASQLGISPSTPFPRSADRGLIEAWSSCGPRCASATAFPRSADRGLIEAQFATTALPVYDLISAIS